MLILAAGGALVLVLPAWRGLSSEIVRRAEIAAVVLVGLLGVWLLVPPFGRRYGLEFLSLEWDIWSVAPQYASFYRAGILVVFAICVIAGVGLAALALRRPRAAAAVAVIAVAFVFLESYTTSADRVLAVEPMPADSWLVQHPGDYVVAEYPLLPTGSGANEYTSEFYQRFHGHPLLNGHISGSESESMREELRDPNRPGVADVLAALNVRYIVWRPDIIKQFAPLNPAYAALITTYEPQANGFSMVASFDDGTKIYQVNSNSSAPFAFYATGFGPVVSDAAAGWVRHTVSDRTSIGVYLAGSAPTSLQLHFTCQTSDPRVVLSAGGDVWSIGPGSPADIRMPVSAAHGITRAAMGVLPVAAAEQGHVWCSPISVVG